MQNAADALSVGKKGIWIKGVAMNEELSERQEKFLMEEYRTLSTKLFQLQSTRIALMQSGLFSTGGFYAFLFSPATEIKGTDSFYALLFLPSIVSFFTGFVSWSINDSITKRVDYLTELEQAFDTEGWYSRQIRREKPAYVDWGLRIYFRFFWIFLVSCTGFFALHQNGVL